MGFRFSRRIGILPGLKLNFSGSGVSLSAGGRGAHLNFGSRGTYASLGIPGTGLSYRQRIGGGRSNLDVTFARGAVKDFDANENLTAFMARSGGRFDRNMDWGLDCIEPPTWLQHEDYKHLG